MATTPNYTLNYRPEDVKTGEVLVASISGSGVAFAMLPYNNGEDPEMMAIAPKIVRMNDIRIGDNLEVGYVENFPDHIERVRWRLVAFYRKLDGTEKPQKGTKPTETRRTVEERVLSIIDDGEVWNRGEIYYEIFGETFVALTASDIERSRYEAVGHSLHRLHEMGSFACAKVYGPAKKNATALYYAKTTHILGRALMGLGLNSEDDNEDEES